MAELFTEPTTDQKAKPGGKVKALQKAPQGGNKQMRKTVGSQVRTLKKNDCVLCVSYRVKSGNFGHQVNSDIHLQTVEIQMRQLLLSRLIRIFIVCLFNLMFYFNNLNMNQTWSLSELT